MQTHTKTAETQAKILNLAEEQLLLSGYSAMSLGQIAGGLKISPTTVQLYFATKADLGLALIRRARQRFKKWKKLPEQVSSNPYFKLVGFIQLYDNYQLQEQRMGFLAASSISKLNLPEAMLAEVEKLAKEQQKYLTCILKEGKENKALKFKGKAKPKATSLLASLVGSLILTRLLGTKTYELITTQILQELKA